MLDEIRDINASLWISASAGTGKTKSLIDRILALLLNGVRPSKILCLTFTNAAAAEMLNRLSQYLQKFYQMTDQGLIAELTQLGFGESYLQIARSLYVQSTQADWVTIQTIHSFCFGVLERFPLETGLLPGISMCDNYQQEQFINEAISSVITNEKYQKNLDVISEYTTDISSFVKSFGMDIKRFVDKHHDFHTLYSELFNVGENLLVFAPNEIDNKLFQELFNGEHCRIFYELAEILRTGSAEDNTKAEILSANAENPSDNFLNAFLTKDGSIRSRLCTQKLEVIKERMQNVAQVALKFRERKNAIESALVNASFFSVMKAVFSEFEEQKRRNHCLDFNDIILNTMTLLENIDWVMYKIDGGLEHVLIDEAQDTSSEQWEIIRKITEEFFVNYQSSKTIFVVGDEKQSIFSFQGADVRLFNKMHEYFKVQAKRCGQQFYDILLNKSYRTTGNILSFVDDVFADTFPGIRHETNRCTDSGVVEVVEAFEGDEEDAEDDCPLTQQSAGKKMSLYLSNFIRKMIDERVFVESKQRPAQASDFLILFQRRNIRTMKSIISALKDVGIQTAGIDRVLLKDEIIVEDLIAFAGFAVFPLNDLMCARVLKSPIVGITENDLMRACLDRKDEGLWQYLLKNQELFDKYSLFKLQSYIDKAFQLSAYNFFMNAITDGVKEKFISRLGEKCLDVLYEFLDVVMKYENANSASLESFLEWFRSFEHEIKKESFSDEHVVRLMTVHASKGLQAPFVILADSHFVKSAGGEEKILKTEEGILFWDFSAKKQTKDISLLYQDSLQARTEESKRLFYVALTRAEDFVYILAEKGKKKSLNNSCWYNQAQNKTEKFLKVAEFGTQLSRSGEYSFVNWKNEEPVLRTEIMALPKWFYEKLPLPNDVVAERVQTSEMIFGESVHLLLCELPKYSFSEGIANSLLETVDLLESEKEIAKSEAMAVIQKFGFLFGSRSFSEVPFVYEGREGRIDKIAFLDDCVWIVDFKTGATQAEVPPEHIAQLKLYKKATLEILKCDAVNIRTAVVWTHNATLAEVII